MADNRPHRPFAANIQVMQRAFLMQASVSGIRVLQNFVGEDEFFVRSDTFRQPPPPRRIRSSVPQKPMVCGR